MRAVQLTSERDVVFTPFMLRVRATLDGEPDRAPLRLRSSELQPTANAEDELVALVRAAWRTRSAPASSPSGCAVPGAASASRWAKPAARAG